MFTSGKRRLWNRDQSFYLGLQKMSDLHSVSELLLQLKQNQSAAAHQLWGRFIDQLIRAASRHLRNLPRRAVDEEDVAAPNPATLELFAGEVREMLDELGDELLRQIAILKLEG